MNPSHCFGFRWSNLTAEGFTACEDRRDAEKYAQVRKDFGGTATVPALYVGADDIGETADWFDNEAKQLREEAAAMKDGDSNKAHNLARAVAFSDAAMRVNKLTAGRK